MGWPPNLAGRAERPSALTVSIHTGKGHACWWPLMSTIQVISIKFCELSKIISRKYIKPKIYGENFKLKLCMFAQSHALGTHTKFQLEILIRNLISAIHKFQENVLESSQNSETPPGALTLVKTTTSTRVVQWNLYNETGEVLLKTHNFCHLPGTVFTLKSFSFSLPRKTTCLERPQSSVVALYRFHCSVIMATKRTCLLQHEDETQP